MKKLKFSGALAGAAVVGALLTSPGASASLPQSPVGGAVASSAQVHLVTGDVVTLNRDSSGRQAASVIKAHPEGVGGVFQSFNLGSHLFVIPQSAAPYLGSTLDPSLFDVTALAQHPRASLRIDVTLRHGAGAVHLPGVTLRRIDATHAVGTFTMHGAKIFGAALVRQAAQDRAQHARLAGMFGSVVRIASASHASTQHASRPADSSTLTVKGIDWNGNPDSGDSVNVYNVDDLNLFATTLTFAGGQAQATVPDGNYSLVSFFGDYTNDNIYVVSIPQVSVTKDTTVTLNATKATAEMSVTTPKPAPQPVFIVEWARTDANGVEASYTFSASDAFHFFVAPTKKAPTVGDLHLAVQIRAQSTGTKKGGAYEYDAKFAQAGKLTADQSYTVKKGDLATINASYAAEQPNTTSVDGRFAAFPWESFLFVGDINFTTPTSRTEYYNGGDSLLWNRFGFAVEQQTPFALLGFVQSPWEHLDPGLKRTEVWNGQPQMPRLYEYATTWNPAITFCPACETSTNLDLYLVGPYSDNSPYHIGFADGATQGLTETQNWTVKADKQTISSGSGVIDSSLPLQSGAKTYTINYNTTRSNPYFVLSTNVKTMWKFAANADLTDLPDGWVCSPSGDTNCGVVPLMTNSYDLGADLLGEIASGDQKGTITIGHLAGASIGEKLTAWFSYDGGKTWTKANVSGGTNGEFDVAFTVPSAGQTNGYGAVRIMAKDQAGGTLKQTILQAFSVK